jgi:hypothetical protein
MNHRSAASLAVGAVLAVCLLSSTGCWQQRMAQQRAVAAQAAAQADANAARAAAEAALQADRAQGTAAATQDIANDVLKQKEYPPLPSPAWHAQYVKLLKERCIVEWEVVQGPANISDSLREEVNAYNEVMRAEIERRFGADIFEKLQAEAEGK